MDWDDHLGISFSEMVQKASIQIATILNNQNKPANLNIQVFMQPSQLIQRFPLELMPLKEL